MCKICETSEYNVVNWRTTKVKRELNQISLVRILVNKTLVLRFVVLRIISGGKATLPVNNERTWGIAVSYTNGEEKRKMCMEEPDKRHR